jgi:uncharacterized protein YdhG (YjbR/CyaY superfamily)
MHTKPTTLEQYLSQQPVANKIILEQLCVLIKQLCPDAVESIAYGMPAYKFQKKPLIYIAWYTHHIGIYATPTTHSHFAQELATYKQWKWSVQFPLDRPIPMDLIEKMIQFKLQEIYQEPYAKKQSSWYSK